MRHRTCQIGKAAASLLLVTRWRRGLVLGLYLDTSQSLSKPSKERWRSNDRSARQITATSRLSEDDVRLHGKTRQPMRGRSRQVRAASWQREASQVSTLDSQLKPEELHIAHTVHMYICMQAQLASSHRARRLAIFLYRSLVVLQKMAFRARFSDLAHRVTTHGTYIRYH